jgi:type 1 glutamine amidotransferase
MRYLLILALAATLQAKHIVLIAGDQEYRSEEALPQLARILSTRHGFKCTVLYCINPKDGTIDPDQPNIPGLEALDNADLMIVFMRWLDLPDEQLKHIVRYVESGRPVIGMRTATHSFKLSASKDYQRYTWDSKEWDGGFGRQVLGETWVAHHGRHGKQSTRGIIAQGQETHPILRGIKDGEIWGPTDVYKVHLPLPGDSQPLILGQVLEGMQPTDKPVAGPQNDPMMPVAWVKTYNKARVFNTTMGSSQDLLNEPLRRMLVNACYWAVGLEKQIRPNSDVGIVGEYHPTPFAMDGFKKGVRP